MSLVTADLLDAGDHHPTKDSRSNMTVLETKPLPPLTGPKELLPQPLTRTRSRHMNMSDAALIESIGRSHQRPRKESSKASLFHLFSRPKVEKFRGYAEPVTSLPPIHESLSRAVSPEPILRKHNSEKSHSPFTRPSTGMSQRGRESPRLSNEDGSRSGRRRNDFQPPPLFQVYAQSVKIAKAQAADGTGSHHGSRRRRESVEFKRSDRPTRSPSLTSVQHSGLTTKIFALTPTGYIMQYTDQGLNERLPEKVLQLTPDSSAMACNFVPGQPYVLQVAQSADVQETGSPSSISLLTRIGLKASLARREVSNLLLVFRTAQELDAWLLAVRAEIQVLGGDGHLLDAEFNMSQDFKQHERRKGEDTFSESHAPSMDYPASSLDAIVTLTPKGAIPTTKPRLAAQTSDTTGTGSVHTTTPHDSPMLNSSPSSPVDQTCKHYPFKVRSAITDGSLQQNSVSLPLKPAYTSVPVSVHESYNHTSQNCAATKDITDRSSADGESRPESFVPDLPMLWSQRAISRAKTPSPTTEADIRARQKDPRLIPLRTAGPSDQRRPIAKPFHLPLKVKPSSAAAEPVKSAISESAASVHEDDTEASSPTSGDVSADRHPRRTSSVKLSLFPSPTSPPVAMPSRPITPGKEARSLRRPASLQVRANPAPFLSSVRNVSGPRPTLGKAPSTPSLRSGSNAHDAVHGTSVVKSEESCYNSVVSDADLHSNAFLSSRLGNSAMPINPTPPLRPYRDRNDSITALPAPRPRYNTTSRTKSQTPGLPALDLGLPVIGLGPPAPPPNRGLPSLPSPPPVPPKVAAH